MPHHHYWNTQQPVLYVIVLDNAEGIQPYELTIHPGGSNNFFAVPPEKIMIRFTIRRNTFLQKYTHRFDALKLENSYDICKCAIAHVAWDLITMHKDNINQVNDINTIYKNSKWIVELNGTIDFSVKLKLDTNPKILKCKKCNIGVENVEDLYYFCRDCGFCVYAILDKSKLKPPRVKS